MDITSTVQNLGKTDLVTFFNRSIRETTFFIRVHEGVKCAKE